MVQGKFLQIELVNRQRLFLQMKDEDFIIDMTRLQHLSTQSFRAREHAFLVVEYVQIWKQRKMVAIPHRQKTSLHRIETDFLSRRSLHWQQQQDSAVQQLPTPVSSRNTTPSPDLTNNNLLDFLRKGQTGSAQPRDWTPRSSRSASMSPLATRFDSPMPSISEVDGDTGMWLFELEFSF